MPGGRAIVRTPDEVVDWLRTIDAVSSGRVNPGVTFDDHLERCDISWQSLLTRLGREVGLQRKLLCVAWNACPREPFDDGRGEVLQSGRLSNWPSFKEAVQSAASILLLRDIADKEIMVWL